MPEGPVQPDAVPLSSDPASAPLGNSRASTSEPGSSQRAGQRAGSGAEGRVERFGAGGAGGAVGAPASAETPKETVISIIIAFAMAFVFRGFVVEAFVIPTGSMAPTLLGQHMRFYDRSSGNDWEVGPWQSTGRGGEYPAIQQNVMVHDPMSGAEQAAAKVALRSGDRILVLKYLYAVMSPRRFDVVVFKDPHDTGGFTGRAADNYIKRLIGLPGEQIALVDGDVFVRKQRKDDPVSDPATLWLLPGWSIARKPALVQRSVWQPVFDSSLTPVPTPIEFQRPWRSKEPGWSFDGGRVYEWKPGNASEALSKTVLEFDQSQMRFSSNAARRAANWSITDYYPYNETPVDARDRFQTDQFSVADVRLRAGIEVDAAASADTAAALSVAAVIDVHNHEFRVEIQGALAKLRVRKPSGEAGVMVWEDLSSAAIQPLKPGRVRNVEFWNADQTMRVFVDDQLVIGPVKLDWSIAERLRYATGKSLEDLLKAQRPNGAINVLDDPSLYEFSQPRVYWELASSAAKSDLAAGGGGVRMHRVAVDRDLFYRPESESSFLRGVPGLATSPYSPVSLNADQFFCCGDNSPQSLDGRLWGAPDPWVARDFGPDFGVVPRELMLGKAFFVYWPSLVRGRGPVPVPDFGRMRFIW